MKERVLIVPKALRRRPGLSQYIQKGDLDPYVRSELLADGWTENTERVGRSDVLIIWTPPEDAILRDEDEMMSEESKARHKEIEKIQAEQDAKRREAEREEAAAMAADLAQRDQNDADVQEIARQVGVFCRGLDEAGVHDKVWPISRRNEDRRDALQIFVITEVGRLREKQNQEED